MAKKFEYIICKRKDFTGPTFRNEKLIQLGQEGWELAGIVPLSGNDDYFFKREIDSPITQKQEKNGYDASR